MYQEVKVSKEELREFFEWIEDIMECRRNEQEIENNSEEEEKKN